MKQLAQRILSRIYPPRRAYVATILAAGLVVSLTLTAPSLGHAQREAEYIAQGGELLSCAEA